MSQQNVTTKPAIDEPVVGFKDPQPRGSFSVDALADRLMDELFDDMEHILDGGRLPTQTTPPPDPVSLKSIQVPQIFLPQMLVPQPETHPVKTAEVETTETQKQKSGRLLDKLLLGGACASLVILVGLLLWNRGDLQRFWTLVSGQTIETTDRVVPKTPEQLKAEADIKFMEYMRRSLATIQREGAKATIPTPPPAAQNQAALPIPMSPPPVNVTVNPTIAAQPDSGNLTEVLNRIAIALERLTLTGAPPTQTVKVPANPPGGQTTAAAPKPAPAPAATQGAPAATQAAKPATPAAPAPSPAPSPSPKPQAEAPKPAPAAPEQPVASLPKPEAAPPLPEQAAETAATAQTEPAPAAAPAESAAAAVHTLVGIIQVGERSVALFEINGASRRINIGESIGSSGWTLGEIKNKEAVIRRNGEVRSIYVGQSI